jgi:uncharacterized membrane protein
MATVASRPRPRSRSGVGSGRSQDHTKPKRAPEKARKPAAAAAVEPHKAHKPAAAAPVEPHKAHKPAAAAAVEPHRAHKPAAAAAVEPHRAHKPASAVKASASRRQSGGARKPPSAKKATRASGASKPGQAAKPSQPRKSGKGSKSVAMKAASVAAPKAGKALVKAASPNGSSLTGRAAWKLAKVVARRALSSKTGAVAGLSREGLERAATAVHQVRHKAIALTSTSVEADATGRPPIQAAVDAAVPSHVAWQEWIGLEWLPEGVDRVLDVERNGDGELTGRLHGRDGGDWAARILDERDEESFAWESTRGSDCAGLITFHSLGERLTRIELSLDIRPVSVAQAAALSARMADRRAAADLRRFKARLELIDPDSYDDPDDRSD